MTQQFAELLARDFREMMDLIAAKHNLNIRQASAGTYDEKTGEFTPGRLTFIDRNVDPDRKLKDAYLNNCEYYEMSPDWLGQTSTSGFTLIGWDTRKRTYPIIMQKGSDPENRFKFSPAAASAKFGRG
jgi:hypothetical protein